MNSLYDTALECNPYTKINFNGGDLSSDAGLLLIKDFIEKIGLKKLVYRIFQTNDTAYFRFHSDPKNLLQMVYQSRHCQDFSTVWMIRLLISLNKSRK